MTDHHRAGTGHPVADTLARGLLLAAIGLYVVVVVRTAWVSDDAYFTFRTIDQWISGNGLVWNAGQRVQAYTHPAWMLVMSAAVSLTREFWLTSIIVSALSSSAAVVIYAFFIARSPQWAIVGVLALSYSRAFVDYSTSGLENPLSYLLVATFAVTWFRMRDSDLKIGLLSLIGAILLLSRQDYVLLIGPAIAYQIFRSPSSWRQGLSALLIGASPLILWEAFSLWYYGFPVPNTAYAKLGAGIPRWLLVEQGIRYFTHSLRQDPVTIVVLIGGLLVAFVGRRTRQGGALAVGVVLYLTYVLWIGGDFMAGRFLAVPLFMATILMGGLHPEGSRRLAGRLGHARWHWPMAAAIVILLGFASPYPTVLSGVYYGYARDDAIDEHGIADERAFYYPGTGLLQLRQRGQMPDLSYLGVRAQGEQPPVIVVASAGLFGYYVGVDTHVVDWFGLGDPLLARLEAEPLPNWRIGHPWRRPPRGYLSTLEAGSNRIGDPDLRIFYDHLREVVEGDLLDPGRLWTILRFNTGWFDHHLDSYSDNQYLTVTLADFDDPRSRGIPTDDSGRIEIPPEGIEIRLTGRRHDRDVSLAVEGYANFGVLFFWRGREVGRSGLELSGTEPAIQAVDLRVPWPAWVFGYDLIRIRPILSNRRFSMLKPSFGG